MPNLLILSMKSCFSSVLFPPDPLCQNDIFSPKGTREMKLLRGVKHVIAACLNAQFQMPTPASGAWRRALAFPVTFLVRSLAGNMQRRESRNAQKNCESVGVSVVLVSFRAPFILNIM